MRGFKAAKRGKQRTKGKGWRLIAPGTKDHKRWFKAALVQRFNALGGRFGIFRFEG
jgi:hypothetical protein